MYQFIAQKHNNLFKVYAACFFMFMSATLYLKNVQRCSAISDLENRIFRFIVYPHFCDGRQGFTKYL